MSQLWANLGTGGTALDARNGSGTGVDSNDAKLLEHDGTNYVYLPGVASNFMSVPDEAALDITGDIDIRVRVAMDDWTPAAVSALVGKWGGASARSWYLRVGTTSGLDLIWTPDGTAASAIVKSSTVTLASVGVTDAAAYWVRATLDVDNGASGNDVKFWYAPDQATEPSSWTQLGTTVTTAGTTSIYAGTDLLEVGSIVSGSTFPTAAKVYRAIVRDGIGGTTVLDVDTSVITSGAATSFTATTGQTVTINRSTSGRKSVAVVNDVWLLGTANYLEIADNDLLDFGASDSFTVMAVVRQWATPTNFGRYLSKRPGSGAGWELETTGTTLAPAFYIQDATNPLTTTSVRPTMTAGAISVVGSILDRSGSTLAMFLNGAVSASTSVSAYGSLANASALRIGAISATNGGYQDFECMAVAVFRRALSASEIAALSTYYATRFP